jgi:hypothetical protein
VGSPERVSILVSRAVDRRFISGAMVSVLVFERVDCGFIGGVMVNVLVSETTIYCFQEKNANLPPMNP